MTRRRAGGRRWTWLLGPLAIVMLSAPATAPAGAADPVPGSQGSDTSLPLTDSAVTVTGRGSFSSLEITVNQTRNLVNQAVSITWKGGTPTQSGVNRFGQHFLQIFQCWGDPDSSVPENPGPPSQQCQMGAVAATPDFRGGQGYPPYFAMTRVLGATFWPGYVAPAGAATASNGRIWWPFRSVTGDVVPIQEEPTYDPSSPQGDFWLNPFFNIVTTNEVIAGYTFPDGRGAELFQVNTGLQSPGLGCGQQVQRLDDGSKKVPQCWIVIVPRGDAATENAGTPFENEPPAQLGVNTSPVNPNAWRNRIAIPIEFNPVDSPCAIGRSERRITGSEVALPAIASWQPVLCTTGSLPPYSYSVVGDSTARQQIATPRAGAPGMAVVSQPLSGAAVDPKSPAVYAPITVSGIVIGANVERNYKPDVPSSARPLSGTRVADINLTPRLAAKLLTQSYRGPVEIGNADPRYAWDDTNPLNLGLDPDFLQFNPEFALMTTDRRIFGGLQLPSGTSDAAQLVWEWILADPEAAAWLSGAPDPWGMKVNPVYATSAALNPTGASFTEVVPNSFPKSDPFCYQAPQQTVPGDTKKISPSPLCGTDWMPYNRGFVDGARLTRAASDSSRIIPNPFALSPSDSWRRSEPQFLGARSMLALTDSPSAVRFGLQAVRLSRAGDNRADRRFIAPDSEGLAKGVAAMKPIAGTGMLETDPTTAAPGAYPLTVVAYAAIKPLGLDAAARSEYAAFIEYAAGSGQVSGTRFGQLPFGYLGLPEALRTTAVEAASAVRSMVADPEPSPTTTPPPPTTGAPDTSASAGPIEGTTPTGASVGAVSGGGVPIGGAGNSGVTSSARPQTSRPSTGAGPTASETPDTEVPVSSDPAATEETVEDTVAESVPPTTPADQTPPTTVAATTPGTDITWSRYGVLGAGALVLGSALGALEITKRARRAPTATIQVEHAG